MELRHLRYFIGVAEALSFRRAAERLHVTQPALSKQIKDLESSVGVRLLDRNTARVSLTDAGAVFLEEARAVIERCETAIVAAREAEHGESGRLTVGNVGALSASFLPGVLSDFRARYPKVEVTLHDATSYEQISALRAGRIQVAFAIHGRHEKLPEDFATLTVLQGRIAVALGETHRLARRGPISLSELGAEPLFCLCQPGGNDQHRQRTERLFSVRGMKHGPIKRVTSYESLIALVAGGHGIAFLLPTRGVRMSEHIGFRPIKEDGDDLVVRLSAVWRTKPPSHLVTNFVEVLRRLRSADKGRRARA